MERFLVLDDKGQLDAVASWPRMPAQATSMDSFNGYTPSLALHSGDHVQLQYSQDLIRWNNNTLLQGGMGSSSRQRGPAVTPCVTGPNSTTLPASCSPHSSTIKNAKGSFDLSCHLPSFMLSIFQPYFPILSWPSVSLVTGAEAHRRAWFRTVA